MNTSRLCLILPVLCCLRCAPPVPDTETTASEPAAPEVAAAAAALSVGSDDSLWLQQSTVGSNDETGDKFGQSLATGDFDGDGYPDLAIGVPYEDQDGFTDVGMVVVFYGSPGGLDAAHWEKFTQISVNGMANESNDLFGYELATGDFDGDGRDDLAVGVPYEDVNNVVNSGAVAIFYGSSGGLFPSNTEVISQSMLAGAGNEASDLFGFALAVGDFDGDNRDDLAIGVPYEDGSAADSGSVAVLYGSTSGLVPISFELLDQDSAAASVGEAGDRFGYSLASGDLDGDGDSELVVGVPYEDENAVADAGMVVVLAGATAGLLPANDTTYFQGAVVSATAEAGDNFGFAVAIGDFNGDGYADVAASSPYEDTGASDAGHIAILRGAPGALPATWSEVVTEVSAHGARETSDRAGYALTTGDFDGDGYCDLVAGVPYEDEDGNTDDDQHTNEGEGGTADIGSVLAFFGGPSGILPARAYSTTQRYLGGTPEANDRFGMVLAAADFDGDGRASLAAGVPYEDVGATTDAGAVLVRTIEPALPDIGGKAAIVIDRATGAVLGIKSPDTLRAPASTTKIMTGLLAVEAIAAGSASLNDAVTIQWDVAIEGGGIVGLAPNDVVSLRDLLYLMLLESGNDAATAVGRHIGGSRSAFVTMMNTRAAQLGLDSTSFVDISGRDPEDLTYLSCDGNEFEVAACGHYSTARDLAALAKYALTKPLFRTIVGTASTTTTWIDPFGNNTWTNTNRLISSTNADYYPAAYGVKTGTTCRSGGNLVSAANDGSANVIAVVLGAADGESSAGCVDGHASTDRFDDSRALLDFGLSVAP